MERILTPPQGVLFLFAYGAAMLGITLVVSHNRVQDTPEFLLARRSVGVVPGAMSIAASWIWAPALFVSAQKAYEQGIAGAFWFIFPNLLALIVFAPVALRIRQVLPRGYTFPQYVKRKHGHAVHVLYLIQFFVLQLCSFAVQILAGATLISLITGLPFSVTAACLVAIVLGYSLRGGFRASVVTDYIHLGLILACCATIVPWCIVRAGGTAAIAAGIGGVSGNFGRIWDPWVAYSFGISTTVGLLAGPIGDQMHWQRAYSLSSDRSVITTFVLAAFLFVLVPFSLCLLGFIAAGHPEWATTSAQMVGPMTVSRLLPSSMMIVFAVMLLSGLCSTLDSILCAVSSLVVCNLFGYSDDSASQTDEDDRRRIAIARWSMLSAAILGLLIALIPGLQIVHLFLFYGTFRASTLIPTLLTLFWSKLTSKAAFYAVALSMLFGAPVLALGAYWRRPHLSVLGTGLVVVLGLGASLLLSGRPRVAAVESQENV